MKNLILAVAMWVIIDSRKLDAIDRDRQCSKGFF